MLSVPSASEYRPHLTQVPLALMHFMGYSFLSRNGMPALSSDFISSSVMSMRAATVSWSSQKPHAPRYASLQSYRTQSICVLTGCPHSGHLKYVSFGETAITASRGWRGGRSPHTGRCWHRRVARCRHACCFATYTESTETDLPSRS